MAEQVTSVDRLREILADGAQHEFYIALNGGARSSKSIYKISDDLYDVFHSISDTWEELTEARMLADTMIGEAIEKGGFFHE